MIYLLNEIINILRKRTLSSWTVLGVACILESQDQVLNSGSVTESKGFPGGWVVKNPPANAGDAGSIPGSGRSHGEGNGNPLQDSCLGNPTVRGIQRATVHGVTQSDMTERLNNNWIQDGGLVVSSLQHLIFTRSLSGPSPDPSFSHTLPFLVLRETLSYKWGNESS